MAHCHQHRVCAQAYVLLCSSAIFILQNLSFCCHFYFPQKGRAEEDRLVVYSSCKFKLAEEGGMACRELQEVSQV